jgi:hypothetical protein
VATDALQRPSAFVSLDFPKVSIAMITRNVQSRHVDVSMADFGVGEFVHLTKCNLVAAVFVADDVGGVVVAVGCQCL